MKYLLIYPAVLMITAGSISCRKNQGAAGQNPAPTALPVKAYTVTREKAVGRDTYPGTVVSLNEVELRAQVSGYITRIFVQDGQRVNRGQELYEIDRTKYRAAYDQAKAALASARANLERVQQDVQRYENLDRQDAIARQRVDYVRVELKTAQSQVAAAEANLSAAATDLRYSLITAPLSGTIGISRVKVGAQVSPGQPLLNTVSTDNPIAVDFVVGQDEIPRFNRLREGQSPGDSLFTLGLADQSAYPFAGKLAAIDRAVDPQTGSITVRLRFPNPTRQLVAGMSVVVRALNDDAGEQIVIPYKAVIEQVGEYYAYVIRADSVWQRKLELGAQLNDRIVVRSGLEAGENIVVQGLQRLRQGAKVQVDGTRALPVRQTATR
jgi:membrane fusion protein (multidrug efflux system)